MARSDIGTLDGDLAAPNIGDRERLVSALGGAVLILNGLVRPSTWHTLLALAGVELMRRGISGRSRLYSVLGVDGVEPRERYRPAYLDHPIDGTLDDSFPASDPPAWTVSSGTGSPAKMH
jgi:uncharacterized membrane protein